MQQCWRGALHYYWRRVLQQYWGGAARQYQRGALHQYQRGALSQYRRGVLHKYRRGALHKYRRGLPHQNTGEEPCTDIGGKACANTGGKSCTNTEGSPAPIQKGALYQYRREPCTNTGLSFGLYTIFPSPILYGMYCNTGWSGENTILRNSMGDEGGGGAQTRGVFANNSIDSCTKA